MIYAPIINQKRIEILLKGDTGIPVLILTGMGCSFEEWYEVTEHLSKLHKIIMFHRPGLGNSDIGDEERSTYRTTQDIISLLNFLNVNEPIIIIGHSYGGLCVQHFVKLYPYKVAGVVLVDSTSVDLYKLNVLNLPFLDENSDEKWIEKYDTYSKMTKEELKDKINPSLTEKQKQLPYEIQKRLIDFRLNPNLYKAMSSEINNWIKNANEIKQLGRFSDIPLVVIGRDSTFNIELGINEGIPNWEIIEFEKMWEQLIIDQATLSKFSKLVFAEKASHLIHVDRPDIIIEAVNNVSNILGR